MSRSVETLVQALRNNDKRWMSMAVRVDYGFLELEMHTVKMNGRTIHADDLLFSFYRTIYDRKMGEGQGLVQWKNTLHNSCIDGLLDLYLREWFLANDPDNKKWSLFKESGFKVENPYPLCGRDDEDDD